MAGKNRATTSTAFRNRLNRIPINPGVYLMRGPDGEILYVGKAAKLKNRIRSYFTRKIHTDPKIETLVKNPTRVSFSTNINKSGIRYKNNIYN